MALLLLILSILLRLATGAAAESEPPRSLATALFVLDDSTVSCGASSSILPLNLTAGPCLQFPSAARHSLLVDLLAANMGLPSPTPISSLNGTAAAAARSVNYGGGQYGGDRGSIFHTGAAETQQLLRLEAGTPPQHDSSSVSGAVSVVSFSANTSTYDRGLSANQQPTGLALVGKWMAAGYLSPVQ